MRKSLDADFAKVEKAGSLRHNVTSSRGLLMCESGVVGSTSNRPREKEGTSVQLLAKVPRTTNCLGAQMVGRLRTKAKTTTGTRFPRDKKGVEEELCVGLDAKGVRYNKGGIINMGAGHAGHNGQMALCLPKHPNALDAKPYPFTNPFKQLKVQRRHQ